MEGHRQETEAKDRPCFAQAVSPLPAHRQPPSIAVRIERALLLLAYFIELDGDVHLAMYEKFEAELEALQKQQATRDRARQRLYLRTQVRRHESDPLEKFEL